MSHPLRRSGSRIVFSIFFTIIIAAWFLPARGMDQADLVLMGGKIATLDEGCPYAEALAVEGEKILAVGTKREIQPYIGSRTRVLQLRGQLAVPGFIDGHAHLLALGRAKMNLDLSSARNWDEVIEMAADAARQKKPGEWIIGSGWHQEKWSAAPTPAIEGYPVHEKLSRIVPNHPVFLIHASGHAAIANAKAMALSGITGESRDPQGGRILRDPEGKPTGVLLDTAQRPVKDAIDKSLASLSPGEIEKQNRMAVDLAVRECLQKGVTSLQDASSSIESIELFRKLVDEDRLTIRLWVMIRDDLNAISEYSRRGTLVNYGGRLTARAVKMFMDGALGAHTAWLLAPYTDNPSTAGIIVDSPEEVRKAARLAAESGFQLCVHAIGDRANREVLDIMQEVFAENPAKKDWRWRIEHAQHISAADVARFGRLGVIASMQTIHCTSDAPWVVKRIGPERAEEGAYVWRKLLQTGAIVNNGSDAPVEDLDPIAGFYAAVTRKLPDGSVFYPAQKMSREEALKAATWNNAYAAFEEDVKGSLAPGKLADITVLSKDILTMPEEEILSTRVVYTIVGGKILYNKQFSPGD